MSEAIVIKLASIRDELDDANELVCAARVQMVIDCLAGRMANAQHADIRPMKV